MKKILVLLAIFAFSGCGPSFSAADLDMQISISSPEIRLNIANGLQQEADISYSITNNSHVAITADSYDILIEEHRPDTTAFPIIADVSGDILPGDTLEGKYTNKFVKVVDADGDQEITLVVYEKKGEVMREIKSVSVPVNVVYEE